MIKMAKNKKKGFALFDDLCLWEIIAGTWKLLKIFKNDQESTMDMVVGGWSLWIWAFKLESSNFTENLIMLEQIRPY